MKTKSGNLDLLDFESMGGLCIWLNVPLIELQRQLMNMNIQNVTDDLAYFSNEKWAAAYNSSGDLAYEVDMGWLLELAGKDNSVQAYFSEDECEGSLVVLRNGKIIRELYDYLERSDENKNVGFLDFENENPLKNWADISSSIDKILGSDC